MEHVTIALPYNDNDFSRRLTNVLTTRIGLSLHSAGTGVEASDLALFVPTLPSTTSSWIDASQGDVENEIDQLLHECFSKARSLCAQYMRRRRGNLVFCTPQPSAPDAPEAANAVLQRWRRQKQAVVTEALYALTKVIALEFATKGVRSYFVDISEESDIEQFCSLLHWLAEGKASYSTGLRIAGASRGGAPCVAMP